MNHGAILVPVGSAEIRHLVTAATRCWRAARDQRAMVQRRLYALFADRDYGMLAPVFNGLLTLYEAALGRPIAIGGTALSRDELALLRLVEGADDRHVRLRCSEGMASAFSVAVQSARIMMAKVLADRIGPTRPSPQRATHSAPEGEERLFPWRVANVPERQRDERSSA